MGLQLKIGCFSWILVFASGLMKWSDYLLLKLKTMEESYGFMVIFLHSKVVWVLQLLATHNVTNDLYDIAFLRLACCLFQCHFLLLEAFQLLQILPPLNNIAILITSINMVLKLTVFKGMLDYVIISCMIIEFNFILHGKVEGLGARSQV